MDMATPYGANSTQSSHENSRSNPKRQKSTDEESSFVDRISELPDEVLVHFLSFLPFRDVVATGLLSKRWKLLWTNVHSLIFEDSSRYASRAERMFRDFVDRVLFKYYGGSIQKFGLKLRYAPSYHFDPWIQNVIARNVEELDLHIPTMSFQLPQSVFSCKTLVVLKLCGSMRIIVPRTASLPKLKTLDLDLVGFEDDESAANLISCCFVLEDLFIRRDFYDNLHKLRIDSGSLKSLKIQNGTVRTSAADKDVLDINAPVLQYLDIKDYLSDSLMVAHSSSLTKAHLDLRETMSCQSLIKCFDAFSSVKFLSLTGTISKTLNLESELPSVKFSSLTHLTMGARCIWRPMLPDFLDCFEKLEVLGLQKDIYSRNCNAGNLWVDPETTPKCLMSCFRVMWTDDFRGSKCELEMIKYILKHGNALQTVELNGCLGYPNQERAKAHGFEEIVVRSGTKHRKLEAKLRVSQKIMNFQKGSKTCEIKFI